MQTTDVRIEGHEVLVNGEPHIPFGVVDNYHCGPDEYKRIRDFGLNHVALDSAFKLMTPEGSVQEDVENLRKQLDEARENSLMGLVLFGGSAPPSWLFERYPDCRMKKPDGTDKTEFTWTQFTLNDPDIRKDLQLYFERTVNSLKDHPALLGWSLWNEPYLLPDVDYHPATIAEYRKWLAKKYGQVEPLNSAWLSRYAGFDEVCAPADRSGTSPVAWTDWMYFRQDNFAEFFRWQANIIRSADPRHPITTKIRKPLAVDEDAADQRAVNTRMWAESVGDAVGFDAYSRLDDAHILRWESDFMRGMSLGKPIWDTESGFEPFEERGRPSPETYKSAFWMKFARGVNGNSFYHWNPAKDCPLNFTYYPDMTPGPELFALQECSRRLTAHKHLLSKARMVRPQVAVLHSLHTQWHHHGDLTATADMVTITNCLYRKHIPYDYLGESDLLDGIHKKYRVLIVVGTRNISDALLSVIQEYIKAGGFVLANARFAEFDECGRKRAAYPPKWLGVRSRKWIRSPRRKEGTLQLERKAINHHKESIKVKVALDTFSSMPMKISKDHPMTGLPKGTVIGSGDLHGYDETDQTREELTLLEGAEVVATFQEDSTPAIVATSHTLYVARDTCWLSYNFADLIESFMLNAGVVRMAHARNASGDEAASLDVVLCETQDHYVLFVTNLPQTIRYDGSPNDNVRIGIPGMSAPMDLFEGTQLPGQRVGELQEVTLNFETGQTRVLVTGK